MSQHGDWQVFPFAESKSCDSQIDDMNLLIFDECHEVVKRNPCNCIMQEFTMTQTTRYVSVLMNKANTQPVSIALHGIMPCVNMSPGCAALITIEVLLFASKKCSKHCHVCKLCTSCWSRASIAS